MLPISTYPMWYNVIPPFMPLDPRLYLAYPTGTKGLDSLIFKNYINYVYGNVYLVLQQTVLLPTYTPYSVGNQFPIVVQLLINMDIQFVHQFIITLVPTIVQVTTGLPNYVPRGSAHQPLDGGQPRDLHGESLLGGDPLGGPPFNPLVKSFGWLALGPHMFIPPWYQPPIVQLVPKLAMKLPYMKLQYPT
jgi:hypothetical protein